MSKGDVRRLMEVGEYIRTKGGCIGNIININEFRPPEAKICVDMNLNDYGFISGEDIKSHSKNIIDLIEARDFVNGERVTDIMDNGVGTEMGRFIAKEHIETILTHEMYEQNCYKVGE